VVAPTTHKQIPINSDSGTLSSTDEEDTGGQFPPIFKEEDELVERDIRDRFKRMCEGYFDKVCKKLVIEHKVSCFTDRIIDAQLENSAPSRTR
jgi:regulator of nonsense transcripts 2